MSRTFFALSYDGGDDHGRFGAGSSAGRVALENGELQIAQGLPECRRFVEEMTRIRMKVTHSARETYGAAAGSHDNLAPRGAGMLGQRGGGTWGR